MFFLPVRLFFVPLPLLLSVVWVPPLLLVCDKAIYQDHTLLFSNVFQEILKTFTVYGQNIRQNVKQEQPGQERQISPLKLEP